MLGMLIRIQEEKKLDHVIVCNMIAWRRHYGGMQCTIRAAVWLCLPMAMAHNEFYATTDVRPMKIV